MKKSAKDKTCIECGRIFIGRGRSKVCSTYCRFWSLFDKSGGPDACWPWQGQINPKSGYGNVPGAIAGKRTSAHRYAWMLHNICDPDMLLICHSCNNRICGNPAHLFLGSHRANMIDAFYKGRPILCAPGEAHHCSKLTEAAVREIRSGGEISELARRFGVRQMTVKRVIRGVTWRHVA